MAERRVYGDPCGIARGLDIVGTRWALLVVRELVLGPKRFSDLRAGLPTVSSEVLAQRLRQLESDGVLERRTLPPPTSARVYELTAWGRELEPVVLAMGRWGSRAPLPPGDAPLSSDALMLALPTVFDSARADGFDATIELRLGHDRFRAQVGDGRLDVTRAATEHPDAVVAANPAGLTEVLWHGRSLAGAERDGLVTVEGSRALIHRFLQLFPAPQPARADVSTRG